MRFIFPFYFIRMEFCDKNPEARWLKRVPDVRFPDALRLLKGFTSAPSGRSDLVDFPDDDDIETTIRILYETLPEVKHKAGAAGAALTDEQHLALMAYGLEKPYPYYLLLNAWMLADRPCRAALGRSPN
jgi:hypothetical protein